MEFCTRTDAVAWCFINQPSTNQWPPMQVHSWIECNTAAAQGGECEKSSIALVLGRGQIRRHIQFRALSSQVHCSRFIIVSSGFWALACAGSSLGPGTSGETAGTAHERHPNDGDTLLYAARRRPGRGIVKGNEKSEAIVNPQRVVTRRRTDPPRNFHYSEPHSGLRACYSNVQVLSATCDGGSGLWNCRG